MLHEFGGLPTAVAPLVGENPARDVAQLPLHQRRQGLERRLFP